MERTHAYYEAITNKHIHQKKQNVWLSSAIKTNFMSKSDLFKSTEVILSIAKILTLSQLQHLFLFYLDTANTVKIKEFRHCNKSSRVFYI